MLILGFMLSLVIFSVPLYKLFCDLTGFQGFNKEVKIQEQQQNIKKDSIKLFGYSIVYLFLIFTLTVIDKYLF